MPLILKILHGNEDRENVTSLISRFSIFYGFLSSAHSPHDRFSMTRSPAFSDGSTFVSSKLTPWHRPARHGCKHGTVTTFHPRFFTCVRRRKHLQPPGPNLSFYIRKNEGHGGGECDLLNSYQVQTQARGGRQHPRFTEKEMKTQGVTGQSSRGPPARGRVRTHSRSASSPHSRLLDSLQKRSGPRG